MEDEGMRWTALAALLALPAIAAELKPKTVEAFDRYIRETEQRLADPKTFLWADESPDAHAARQGRRNPGAARSTPKPSIPFPTAWSTIGSAASSSPAPPSNAPSPWCRTTTATRTSTSPK